MPRVPEGAAGRELYALLGRPFHTLSEPEWRQWQERWAALFAPPPAPWPYEGAPPHYGLSREERAGIPAT